METVNEILLQSFLIFLWGGSIVGILAGVGMFHRPEQLMRFNQQVSRWVDTERMTVKLDRPRWFEPFIYRHHRLVGLGLLIGAVFVLYTFLFSYNVRVISSYIPQDYWWLSDALIAILLVGSMLASLIGIVVLAKPSLLREIEVASNRWICTTRLSTLFNSQYHFAEQFLFQHHRLFGVFILLSSLYVIVLLDYVLF